MTFLNGLLALHGSGVGGGSLTYGNVLMEPDDRLFQAPAWRQLADWKALLSPHYQTARRMLGVTTNPRLEHADNTIKEIAQELGRGDTFRATDVAVFFGQAGQEAVPVPDPYFGGAGPDRAGCNFCGGCMVGCRYNAKNILTKNYLYFAEKAGARVLPEATVRDIRPIDPHRSDGARFEVAFRRTTDWLPRRERRVVARSVVVSAGALGTLELLFRCREITRSLSHLSPRLGDEVRSNSENILGVTARRGTVDQSKGIAISSIFQADDITRVEPVRYSDGSSFIRVMTAPHVQGATAALRFLKTLWSVFRHPVDFLYAKVFSR
jgi:cholesterol oxidase